MPKIPENISEKDKIRLRRIRKRANHMMNTGQIARQIGFIKAFERIKKEALEKIKQCYGCATQRHSCSHDV